MHMVLRAVDRISFALKFVGKAAKIGVKFSLDLGAMSRARSFVQKTTCVSRWVYVRLIVGTASAVYWVRQMIPANRASFGGKSFMAPASRAWVLANSRHPQLALWAIDIVASFAGWNTQFIEDSALPG